MEQIAKCWIKIYSNKQYQKIVAASEKQEGSDQQLAKRFSVSLGFIQLITSAVIATTAALGNFVASVQAATFTLPIEPAAKATGVDVLRDLYGLDGTGITIGVISDSFATAKTLDTFGKQDTYATDIALFRSFGETGERNIPYSDNLLPQQFAQLTGQSLGAMNMLLPSGA